MKTKIQSEIIKSGLSVIPLAQGRASVGECVVKVGQDILAGELLAKPKDENGMNIYSPISGRVIAIDKMMNTASGMVQSVLISPDPVQLDAPNLDIDTNKENLFNSLKISGLLSHDKLPLQISWNEETIKNINNLNIAVFDEYNGADLQEFLIQDNVQDFVKSVEYLDEILGLKCVNFYYNRKNQNFEEIKNSIIENIKNKEKINFFAIKMPKNKNNFDFFSKFLAKNNLFTLFETPEIILNMHKVLSTKKPLKEHYVFIGGSALQKNNGYVEVESGVSLDYIKNLCGGLEFEEQDLIDMQSDLADILDTVYDLKEKYKNEKDKLKKAELKSQYKSEKKKADSEIWKYIKNQRANLMKTIRQIRVGSMQNPQIFTDFSPILDFSDNAVYFLNRKEV